MKIITGQDSSNRHVIAIEHEGELRCIKLLRNAENASAALFNINKGIARHGEAFVLAGFKSLPRVKRGSTGGDASPLVVIGFDDSGN